MLLFDGRKKGNQKAHLAVVRLDVGTRDLQQCADAVMRLRAEYLWASHRAEDVCFPLTNGDAARWAQWERGERPHVEGNRVHWSPGGNKDSTHPAFRRYLDFVFVYAGSASLARGGLEEVSDTAPLEPGDIFIQGGFPGHAVLVVDVVTRADGAQKFALVQSYMPAQQVQVLDSPKHPGTVWYDAQPGAPLVTPEWRFPAGSRMRFPTRGGCSRR